MQELLGNSHQIVILFLTTGLSEGHWTGIFMRGGTLNFFDSYALAPDEEDGWLSHNKLVELHEDIPLVRNLFKKAHKEGYPIAYNHIAYQDPDDTNSETCGRHVAVRLQHADLSDSQYAQLINREIRDLGVETADDVVVYLTHAILGK